MTFPIDLVRTQFPSLLTTDAGQPRIYFDNAAGTQVPQQTIDHIADYFQRYNSNTGVFNPTSVAVDAMYAEVTRAMADFLGTPDPGEVLIGASMTTLTYPVAWRINVRPAMKLSLLAWSMRAMSHPGCRWRKIMA